VPIRHLPNEPNLEYLKGQAKALLAAFQSYDPIALADFHEFHPREVAPDDAKLTDAQLRLARACQQTSWPWLRIKVDLLLAILNDDVAAVRDLVTANPDLMTENVRNNNWGPPMSQAANLGREQIVEMLAGLGAKDLDRALNRAALPGQTGTMRKLIDLGAQLPVGIIMGTCETVNGEGLRELVELGADLCDAKGDRLAPVALALTTYGRDPSGKHEVLRLLEGNLDYPDTPAMAIHRGRIDLLEGHLRRDPKFISLRLNGEDLYPKACGCGGDDGFGLHGTPLGQATLLHMAIDFYEREIFAWLLEHGADVNARAGVDADGFGGHTPLFSTVVIQPGPAELRDGYFTRTLLEQGADPSIRASIRKKLAFIDEEEHRYRDVTALEYGRAFHEERFVDKTALTVLEQF